LAGAVAAPLVVLALREPDLALDFWLFFLGFELAALVWVCCC